ncbi:MAG: RNA-binding S4 domain-containing protein [Saccharospirillaceae bacterium]|nr:RNA-binding S4 domain-containing protein [Pseudomonadales bacterium]NRB80276.1 RNA-binding S4 domain-containing protein [Saccharospirillaceae bacterium]
MQTFSLDGHPYIALNNLLKTEGLCETGGQAKNFIADGHVKVDGAVELRKTCKIKVGQVVEFQGVSIQVGE